MAVLAAGRCGHPVPPQGMAPLLGHLSHTALAGPPQLLPALPSLALPVLRQLEGFSFPKHSSNYNLIHLI